MPGAVGGVQVHHDRRIPRRVHPGERGAGLRRFGLEVVAVQIEVQSIGALAHQLRAVLLRAVHRLGPQRVVAVGVVIGRDEHDEPLQQFAPRAGQLAQQGEHGFLPLHFPRVDVRLQVDHQLAGRRRFRRRRHDGIRGDHEIDRPAQRRGAHLRNGDRRARELQGVEECPHLRAGGGRRVLGALGRRLRQRLGRERPGRRGEKRDETSGVFHGWGKCRLW